MFGVSSRLRANGWRQGCGMDHLPLHPSAAAVLLSLFFPAYVATTSIHIHTHAVISCAQRQPRLLSYSTWSIRLQFTPWNHISTPQQLHILSPLTRPPAQPLQANNSKVTRRFERATRPSQLPTTPSFETLTKLAPGYRAARYPNSKISLSPCSSTEPA